jgi:putative FmdB family regulatory protein
MPVYEYRCRTCDEVFEARRPMSESSASATCPSGHDGAVRLLSVFAAVGGPAGGGSPAPASGGGCCGGGCGCHR